jgi:hypothetical protein
VNDHDPDDRRLEDLILGRLADEEREGLEARLLADDGLAERAAALEDTLAEAFTAGTLSAVDREAFEARLEHVPRLRDRVARARAFDTLAACRPRVEDPVRARPAAAPLLWTGRLRSALEPPPLVLPWAFAASLVAAVGASVIGRQQIERHRHEADQLRGERDAARAEAERLAAGHEITGPAFLLSPGLARGDAGIATLRLPASGPARLVLDLLDPVPAEIYRAVLYDDTLAQILAHTGLRAALRDGAPVVVVPLDRGVLPPGRFELRLEALEGGKPRPAGTYVFRTLPNATPPRP